MVEAARSFGNPAGENRATVDRLAQKAVPPEHLDPPDHEPCRAEHNPGRDARQLHPRRYTRELSLDEVDLVFDRGEVGAREADLAQCEGVLVWYALGRGRLSERFINR